METKIIEFIGTPGSGKSRLSETFFEKLKITTKVLNISYEIGKAKKRERIILKLKYVLYFLLKNIILSIKIWKYLKSVKCLKRKLKLFFNFLFIQGIIWKNMEKYNYIIFDQGLLQGIWSYVIDLEKNDTLKIEEGFRILGVNNYNYLTVLIEVERNEIIKRLSLRKGTQSSFEKIENTIILEKKINDSRKILKDIFEKSKKNLKLQNNKLKDIEKNTTKLMNYLFEHKEK